VKSQVKRVWTAEKEGGDKRLEWEKPCLSKKPQDLGTKKNNRRSGGGGRSCRSWRERGGLGGEGASEEDLTIFLQTGGRTVPTKRNHRRLPGGEGSWEIHVSLFRRNSGELKSRQT